MDQMLTYSNTPTTIVSNVHGENLERAQALCIYQAIHYSKRQVRASGFISRCSADDCLQPGWSPLRQMMWRSSNLRRCFQHYSFGNMFNPLKTKRRLLYSKTQSVPRCKHFSTRLQKLISLCCMGQKSLFVIIIFLHRLGRLTCSGIDALSSFPGAPTISSCSEFVVEGVFRQSVVIHFLKVVDPILFLFGYYILYSRDL